jgi:hypothetical protein
MGGGTTCTRCLKYHEDGSVARLHYLACTSVKWTYMLPRDPDRKYFCFWGCKKIEKSLDCKLHLVRRHGKLLHLFGIHTQWLRNFVEDQISDNSSPESHSNDEMQSQDKHDRASQTRIVSPLTCDLPESAFNLYFLALCGMTSLDSIVKEALKDETKDTGQKLFYRGWVLERFKESDLVREQSLSEYLIRRYIKTREAIELKVPGAPEDVILQRDVGQWFKIGLKT